jgi:anaerobic selenocysteine-containing dehydrogenase
MRAKIDRRDFVRFVTGGALGAAASGVGVQGVRWVQAGIAGEEVKVPGGSEKWSLGVCTLCETGCGLRARTIGNRVVKLQGNPMHPVNRGGLCPAGLAGLQELYHPDRLRSPRRNVGTRQAPRWRDISWPEAVSLLTGKLRELRQGGLAHTVALIDRGERSLRSRLLRQFLGAYGSPNYLTMPSGLDSLQAALYLQQGVTAPVAFDWENTRYLLSFGVNFLEGWGSPLGTARAFGRWRDSAAGRRAKFVQVESRFSITAAKADEWVALRPGAEAVLAMGIARVLITEQLFDTAFVAEHTFGFEDWRDAAGQMHTGFRSMVLGDYRLDEVAAVTGVPAETILRIAREFAANRPALAIGDHQTSTLTGNPHAAMAVHSLNAMVGSIDAPGGVLVQPEPPLDEREPSAARPRLDASPDHLFPVYHLGRLPGAILAQRPYPVNAVLLHEVDPVFHLQNGEELRRALGEVPFIAAFTPFLNESAALADVILPVPTGLEKWQAALTPPTVPHAVVTIGQPVIPPRHGTRDSADVVLEVARALRGPLAAAFPFASFEEYLKRELAGIFAARRGVVFSPPFEETWHRLLERSGWWAPSYSTPVELWEQMLEKGGWWEPSYTFGRWDRVLRTPSGRFEFYPQKLAEWAKSHPEFARGGDRLILPHPPRSAGAPKGELLLMPIEVLPLLGGTGAHLPYLQQIVAPHLAASWDSWLEIHPETAKRLGIADGAMVRVESRRGQARVRARHYVGAHPEVVYLPLGYGHLEGGEWSRRGVNPMRLLESREEPVTGLPQVWNTYVRIHRT